jgi:hypothetical protein
VVVGLVCASSAQATITVSGQWMCRDRGVTMPLRDATVEDHTTGFFGIDNGPEQVSATDANGDFTFHYSHTGNHFFRVVLNDGLGQNGLGVHLAPWPDPFGDWHTDTSGFALSQGTTRDIGARVISQSDGTTPDCAVWQGFHDAYLDYVENVEHNALPDVGATPPFANDFLVRGDFWPNGGVPFTLFDVPDWVSGFPTGPAAGDFTTTRHEFGHALRQRFDGDSVHFFSDVAFYGYAQHHNHCQATNPGFAFNEGWAEYWSSDTATCHGDDPTGAATLGPLNHPTVEGDVAATIAQLQAYCNNSRADMVRALQLFPGQIHSYDEYEEHINRCVPTPSPSSPPAPSVTVPNPEAGGGGISPSVLHYLQSEHDGMHREIGTMGKRLAGDLAALRTVHSCRAGGCDRLIAQRLLAPIIRGHLSMLKLEYRDLGHYDTSRALVSFSKLRETQQVSIQRGLVSSLTTAAKRTATGSTRQALVAIGGLLRRDHSFFAKRIGALLRSDLNNARRGVLTADLFSNGTPAGTVLRRVARRTFQPPAPFPGIFTPARALTLSCPAAATVKGSLDVSGQLSPAVTGAPITLTYSLSGGSETVTHTATTSAAGTYADSAPADAIGNWTVRASWAGDAFYSAATSPVCTVNVHQ